MEKKWIQVFVDDKDSEESVPMRFDPEIIYGFKKLNQYKTILFTKIGPFVACEDYDHFCTRLYSFVNNDDLETTETVTTKKRYLVKRKPVAEEETSYYDNHQPETNS